MYDLSSFRQRVKELYHRSYPYEDGRRATQADLASAVGLSVAEMNRRLNGTARTPLTDRDIRAIVRTLTEWGAISTQAEALDLLDLVCCPQFSASEWNAPPLDSLAPLRPSTAAAPAPPPPTRAEKTNLPLPLTSFIGRAREKTAVARLLDKSRLLTLSGPGGVGKTRLALATAEKLTAHFADGVWLVELAGLTDPQLVVQAIASVLKITEQVGKPLIETLLEALEPRETLLVLDNCEHLLLAVAQTVHRLLSYCPRLRVLTTSREALRIQGEVRFSVSPLPLPAAQVQLRSKQLTSYPAIHLFVERAKAVWPDFQLSESNALAVREICQRLDGLPLAIELAATRVGTMSVAEINCGLADRFTLLAEGDRITLPRQQTLYALIDWSYSLLTAEEQRLFRAMAVFAGGFVLEAAAAVAYSEEDTAGKSNVADTLEQLSDKSLIGLAAGDNSRYRMLETIREYALARLGTDGEQETIMRRHRDYYLRLAEAGMAEAAGKKPVGSLARLELEHNNLRVALNGAVARGEAEAALRLAAVMRWFWNTHGFASEGRRWLDTALTMSGEVDESIRASALFSAGILAWRQGDYAAAGTYLEQCLALRRLINDVEGMTSVLNAFGMLAWSQGDYITARRYCEEGLSIYRKLPGPPISAWFLNDLGIVVRSQGDYPAAQALAEEALAAALEAGNKGIAAYALCNLGDIAYCQGDYTAARSYSTQGLKIRRELEDRQGVLESLEVFARLTTMQGQATRAACLFGAAEPLRKEIGTTLTALDQAEHQRHLPILHQSLGETAFTAAWAEGAAMTLEQAIEYALGEDT